MRAYLIAVAVLLFLPAQGHAGNCDCPFIPKAGNYTGPADLRLDFLDGTDDACPTGLYLSGFRFDGEDIAANLICNPGTGKWSGAQSTGVGIFLFDLHAPTNAKPGPSAGLSKLDQALKEAASFTNLVEIKMALPPLVGGGFRSGKFNLAGQGQTAPCLCKMVREELDFDRRVQAIYKDPLLLKQAQKQNLRAKNFQRKYWQDTNGQLNKFGGSTSQQTYEDLVARAVGPQNIAASGSAQPGSASTSTQSPTGPAATRAKSLRGKLSPDAAAEIDTTTCEISLPTAADVRKQCIPAPVLESFWRHESEHKKKCVALNASTEYILPDGTKVDWTKAGDPVTGTVIVGGVSYPTYGGYSLWGEDPAQHAADEVAAYGAGIAHLEQWLATHCP